MNEKRIEQVMEIEREAQRILDAAREQAARLPLDADRDAQDLIEKARLEAEAEAKRIIDEAGAKQETQQILSTADEHIRQSEATAAANQQRAIDYVLDKVLGKA